MTSEKTITKTKHQKKDKNNINANEKSGKTMKSVGKVYGLHK